MVLSGPGLSDTGPLRANKLRTKRQQQRPSNDDLEVLLIDSCSCDSVNVPLIHIILRNIYENVLHGSMGRNEENPC